MKPYKIIEGSSQDIAGFEEKIAAAIDMGYALAGDLVSQPLSGELKFFQPVILDDEDEYDLEVDEDEAVQG